MHWAVRWLRRPTKPEYSFANSIQEKGLLSDPPERKWIGKNIDFE
jgi:hypothetical protein